MATIALQAHQNLIGVDLGTDEYTAAVASAKFTPTTPSSAFTDVTGKTTNFSGLAGWVMSIDLAQDWATAASLSHYLIENEGDELTATITVPGGSWAATVEAVAGEIGGAGNTVKTATVTLPCKTKPVWTADA